MFGSLSRPGEPRWNFVWFDRYLGVYVPDLRRTAEEKLAALREQLAMLDASAASYDAGTLWEAKRLATVCGNLLLDGRGKILPLLVQLGMRSKIPFISTAREIPSNMAPRLALVLIGMGGADGVNFTPYCKAGFSPPWTHQKKFADWWEQPVFGSADGRTLSRKNVVFSLRSQDGGAHFDEEWGSDLSRLIATTGDERLSSDGKPIANAHLATMRQIAWELTETLKTALR
ncbi:MAG: hypothetical protein ABI192_09360 [Bradyrhizobium sp.]